VNWVQRYNNGLLCYNTGIRFTRAWTRVGSCSRRYRYNEDAWTALYPLKLIPLSEAAAARAFSRSTIVELQLFYNFTAAIVEELSFLWWFSLSFGHASLQIIETLLDRFDKTYLVESDSD
jgi:hypothetical protein